MKLPIYQKIENDIKDEINNNKLKEGDLIHSENQLAEIYKVSRMTVRQALNNLVSEGYLYKHKGKGTFVSHRKIEKNIHGVRGFTEEMESLGKIVRSEVTKFEVIVPKKEIADKLFLNGDEKAFYIERVRYADNSPVLYEVLYIPYTMFKDLTKEDMVKSFYSYIEDLSSYKISHCMQTIEALGSDRQISDVLEISKNSPILRIVRNTFLSNGRPFEYVISTYRSDQYRFVQYAFKD